MLIVFEVRPKRKYCYPSLVYESGKCKKENQLQIRSFIICPPAGLSIKCWDCRSDTDPKCADPFDNSTLSITDCKQMGELEHLPGVLPTMCRKIRQKGSFQHKIQFDKTYFNFLWAFS